MNEDTTLSAVRELVAQGFGRIKIAKELGLSRSQTEKLMRAINKSDSEVDPETISVKDAAELLGLDERSVRERLIKGQLQGEKRGLKGVWVVYRDSLAAAVQKSTTPSRKTDRLDEIRQIIREGNFTTYDLAKKYAKSPAAMNSQIRKATGDFNPAGDWVKRVGRRGVKLSFLTQQLKIKDKDKACEILKENFPDCFIIESKLADGDYLLVPVYDSKKEVEQINVETSKKPFKYYVSPGNNYMVIKVDDNYGDDRLRLPGISDVHVGSIHHRPELFDTLIDWCATESGMLPLINGDITETITKQSNGGLMEQYSHPNDQVTEACLKLSRIAHLIPSYVEGNHEQRTERFSDFSQGRVIAALLKVPYFSDRVIIDIHWRGLEKRVSCTHRYRNAYSIAAVENEVKRIKQFSTFHVDAWFSGHNHYSFILPQESLVLNSGVGFEHKRWYILNNGSCVGRTGGYAEKFPPAPQDLVYLEIFENDQIEAKSIPITGI